MKIIEKEKEEKNEQESKLKDEQQRLLSVPRKFEKTEKLKALWAVQLLMVPHTVIGPAILATSLFWATTMLAGSPVAGTITDMRTTTDSEGARRYELKYDFRLDNHVHHASSVTNYATYTSLSPGSHVSAKVLPQLPDFGTQLLDGNAPWPAILFTAAFGTIWTALMLILVQHVYIAPFRRTNVMRNGKILLGRITDKSISGEDHDVYTLSFQYEPLPGQYRTDKNTISEANFKTAKVGDKVTVLYDPEHPTHSLVYRYSDYKLLG